MQKPNLLKKKEMLSDYHAKRADDHVYNLIWSGRGAGKWDGDMGFAKRCDLAESRRREIDRKKGDSPAAHRKAVWGHGQGGRTRAAKREKGDRSKRQRSMNTVRKTTPKGSLLNVRFLQPEGGGSKGMGQQKGAFGGLQKRAEAVGKVQL